MSRFLDHEWVRRLGSALPPGVRQQVAVHLGRGDETLDRSLAALIAAVESRLRTADLADTAAWNDVRTLDDWESFRKARLDALSRALGPRPSTGSTPRVEMTGSLEGDRFRIDRLVFESRPGLLVTANLYRPHAATGPRPAILIAHSHHHPKSQAELQDLGTAWARRGCEVLVPDLVGHGERRQHPFAARADHPAPFRVDRQDYFFRYVLGIQLDLIGESLMGWMVQDLMRCVDLLRGRPTVDPDRIALIGAVAGGGDVAAVTAALDPRIGTVVVFNLGGAVPDASGDARIDREDNWSFHARGSWESTRNLRLSARGGFAPWFVLAACAPRRMVYAREFAWEPRRDPVWGRLRRIYRLHGAPANLASVHGSGSGAGHAPTDTHCNNVGPVHRKALDPILSKWLGIAVEVEHPGSRNSPNDLNCLPAASRTSRPVHQLTLEIAESRLASARRARADLPGQTRRRRLQDDLTALLGAVEPRTPRVVDRHRRHRTRRLRRSTISERFTLEVQDGIEVPCILERPYDPSRVPVVIALAQDGQSGIRRRHGKRIARLVSAGAAVFMLDPRGTGQPWRGDRRRGRRAVVTAVSSSHMMLGDPLIAARLRDLRAAFDYLRQRDDLDASTSLLWGDSHAPPNPPGVQTEVPFDVDPYPELCEPLGGLLAVLGALFEDQVRAVYICRGLAGFRSMLAGRLFYVPHDVVIPGLLEVADVDDLVAALAPCPVWLDLPVDGCNRPLAADRTGATAFPLAHDAYGATGEPERLRVTPGGAGEDDVVDWMLGNLLSD